MEPGRHPLALLALMAMAVAVGVVCLAPASLLDGRLARATGGTLRLASTQGTLWHGRGVVTEATARLPLEWNIDPWPLLRGTLHMRVRSDTGAESPRGTLDLRTREITLQDADVTVPAAVILGSRDLMTPLKAGKAIAAAIPAGRVTVLDGAGHMLMSERPEEVLAALRV